MLTKLKKFIKITSKTFFLLVIFNIANAEVYNEIKVQGNERLSAETIVLLSGLKIGSDLNDNDLNNSIKKLYKTDYFKDIEILSSKNVLIINIIENPIIQTIEIKGVKNKTILKQLTDITKKSEKYPYLKKNIKVQKNLLLNTVRAIGFYFAEIDTKIIDNKNNSVNLLYEFNLGNRAVIKKINFQGNKIFYIK